MTGKLARTDAAAAQPPLDEVVRRVRHELEWRVIGWTELGTGTNNRLVRLDLADGPPLLAKLYVPDRWNRLGSEYAALAYLARRGIGVVPRPILRDDEHLFGVYSFEAGERRAPAALTTTDMVAAARLAADLHSFSPGPPDGPGVNGDLESANAACFSYADQIRLIEWRLRAFEEQADADLRDLPLTRGLRPTLERLVAAVTDGLSAEEIARQIPRIGWRLNTYDFGPHNWLFRLDGGLTAVDFEGAGWDDPARMVMGCVSHPGSRGLSIDAIAAFLGAYAEARGLSDDEVMRYERIGRLYDIEWATVYAYALTSEVVEAKRFGVPGFTLETHLAECIAGLRERLARAERGDAYRFPSAPAVHG
jgi:Ser/Thr protein kinase RdoA (MazF antagonist)